MTPYVVPSTWTGTASENAKNYAVYLSKRLGLVKELEALVKVKEELTTSWKDTINSYNIAKRDYDIAEKDYLDAKAAYDSAIRHAMDDPEYDVPSGLSHAVKTTEAEYNIEKARLEEIKLKLVEVEKLLADNEEKIVEVTASINGLLATCSISTISIGDVSVDLNELNLYHDGFYKELMREFSNLKQSIEVKLASINACYYVIGNSTHLNKSELVNFYSASKSNITSILSFK